MCLRRVSANHTRELPTVAAMLLSDSDEVMNICGGSHKTLLLPTNKSLDLQIIFSKSLQITNEFPVMAFLLDQETNEDLFC